MSDTAPSSNAVFSVSSLLANASAETGLTDFGDEEFREGLTRLVDATNEGMVLSPLGAQAFQGEVHRLLVNRLRFAEDLKRHPEILDEDVSNPVVILGMPRTGTTKLQRLLAADPEALGLKFWQLTNPARFPDSVAGAEDPRIEAGRQALAIMAQIAPGLLQSHPVQVDDTDEEIFLQLFSFRCQGTYLTHPAPDYLKWMSTQSPRGAYRYMKQLLQYLQWQSGGKQQRHWVLKTPLHLGNLDLLVEMFPAATYVFTHRNLHEVLPSFCRLIEMFWCIKMDNVDMHALGRFMLDLWSEEMNKNLRLRESLGSRIDIFDVQYDSIKNDPYRVIRDIYCRMGRTLTATQEQAMRRWEQKDAYGNFGQYSYSLEQYGLSREMIDTAFSEYHRRFAA